MGGTKGASPFYYSLIEKKGTQLYYEHGKALKAAIALFSYVSILTF
jgi:hypothetical protein